MACDVCGTTEDVTIYAVDDYECVDLCNRCHGELEEAWQSLTPEQQHAERVAAGM